MKVFALHPDIPSTHDLHATLQFCKSLHPTVSQAGMKKWLRLTALPFHMISHQKQQTPRWSTAPSYLSEEASSHQDCLLSMSFNILHSLCLISGQPFLNDFSWCHRSPAFQAELLREPAQSAGTMGAGAPRGWPARFVMLPEIFNTV